MDYYCTGGPGAAALLPSPTATPVYYATAPGWVRGSGLATKVLAEALLGVVSLGLGLLASGVVLLWGTYDGDQLTHRDVVTAHQGQLALLLIALWISAPWLATAAKRRSTWRLQAMIGVLSAAVPIAILAEHLHVTDWTQVLLF